MHGWLYHMDKPEGEIFAGEAYVEKVKAGWVDSPALINADPPKSKGKPGPKPKGGQ